MSGKVLQSNLWQPKIKPHWIATILFVLAFLQFSNTLDHGYAYDDAIVITQNEAVKSGIKGIPKLFQQTQFLRLSDQYGYRPIVLTSYALEVTFFGLNPMVGHTVNVILFSLLCSLIFLVLTQLFRPQKLLGVSLIAIIFLVHPIHVEAVANIKGRDEILCLLFCLLSLRASLSWISSKKILSYFGFVLFFLLAILSKEHAAIFSLIIPWAVISFHRPNWAELALLSLPLALIGAWAIPYSWPFQLAFILGVGAVTSLLFAWRNQQLGLRPVTGFGSFSSPLTADPATHPPASSQVQLPLIVAGLKKQAQGWTFQQVLAVTAIWFGFSWALDLKLIQFAGFIGLLSYYFLLADLKKKEYAYILLAFCLGLTSLLYFKPNGYLIAVLPIGLYHLRLTGELMNRKVLAVLLVSILCLIPAIGNAMLIMALSSLVVLVLLANKFRKLRIPILLLFAIASFISLKDFTLIQVFVSLSLCLAIFSTLFRLPSISAFAIFVFYLLLSYPVHQASSHQLWQSIHRSTEDNGANLNAQQDSIALSGLYLEDREMGNSLIHVKEWDQKLPNTFLILGKYLKNFFVPYPLVYYYGYSQIPLVDWGHYQVILSLLIHVLLILGIYFLYRRRRVLAFGLLFYLIAMVPYSHIFVQLPDTMADRFLFTPSLGLAIALVAGLDALFNTSMFQSGQKDEVKNTRRS